MTSDDYLPDRPDGRLVDYETANVVTPMIHPPQPRLVVKGFKPRPGMEVSLVPVNYIQQPEYWEIHVLGSLGLSVDPGETPEPTPLPAEPPPVAAQIPAEGTPYTAELDLEGCTGTAGIEVVGSNQTERIAVPGPAPTEE